MSVAQGYEKIPTNGLVFMYDVVDSTSYKGEPTTNVAYAVNNNLNSGGNWWVNGGNATFNDNDTSISKPKISNVDTTNLYIFSSTVTGAGSNQQLGTSIIPISPSTTYSFSIWYYFTGTVMVVYPYIRTGVNNNNIGTFSYNGNTDGTTWPKNQWILLKATGTTQSNETGIYMSSYTGNAVGDKVYYFGYQVEQKDHCTPLVLGTRSGTQALFPLVSNNTLDLSNVSFDANAQITFDGTNDCIIVPTSDFNKTDGQPLTVEVIMKPGRNAGQYQDIVVNRSDGQYNWMLYQHATDGSIQLHGVAQYKSTYIPTIGQYIHVVATVTSGQVYTLYVNGTVQQVVSGYSYNGSSPSLLCIGVFGTSKYEPYLGNIDIAKIYNQALTQEEVQQSYNKYKTRFNLS